jgi:hypothetical protein
MNRECWLRSLQDTLASARPFPPLRLRSLMNLGLIRATERQASIVAQVCGLQKFPNFSQWFPLHLSTSLCSHILMLSSFVALACAPTSTSAPADASIRPTGCQELLGVFASPYGRRRQLRLKILASCFVRRWLLQPCLLQRIPITGRYPPIVVAALPPSASGRGEGCPCSRVSVNSAG